MAEVRVVFDTLIAKYPVMGEHLKATAKIVHRAAFETGVVKVINCSLLASAEALVLKRHKLLERSAKRERRRLCTTAPSKREQEAQADIGHEAVYASSEGDTANF
ncbi:hypothetical protein PC123_g25281 [Phytophthora cactorum]|nr:hypothetical protein PC123_g25281 [Phytophthora cactorum]